MCLSGRSESHGRGAVPGRDLAKQRERFHPFQPYLPNSDKYLLLGKPSQQPAVTATLGISFGGSPSPAQNCRGGVRNGAEGDRPRTSPQSLSSERTSSEGESPSTWGAQFKEKGWTAETRRWQPGPVPGTSFPLLSEDHVPRRSSRPVGPEAGAGVRNTLLPVLSEGTGQSQKIGRFRIQLSSCQPVNYSYLCGVPVSHAFKGCFSKTCRL